MQSRPTPSARQPRRCSRTRSSLIPRIPSRRSEPALVARTPFIGLTGGIGAGKSEALRALERLGAATLSTDAVTHELLATEELRDLLVAELGPGVAPGGRIDRGAVASNVFGDDEK